MGMKSAREDGGECWRQWYRTRKANLLHLSGEPPANLFINQLNLTVCCRYSESLVKSFRISRYLSKHHPSELRELRELLVEFERLVTTPGRTV
jgi:hypothetical protein